MQKKREETVCKTPQTRNRPYKLLPDFQIALKFPVQRELLRLDSGSHHLVTLGSATLDHGNTYAHHPPPPPHHHHPSLPFAYGRSNAQKPCLRCTLHLRKATVFSHRSYPSAVPSRILVHAFPFINDHQHSKKNKAATSAYAALIRSSSRERRYT